MLNEAIFSILYPVLYAYAMLRFKNIWGLKTHLQRHPNKLLKLTYLHYFMRRGSFVGLTSQFADTPYFPHGIQGIFISNEAKIGRGAVIFQQVTIGSNTLPDSKCPGSPIIGDHAYLGAGAKLIGGVTIGNHCRVGANAVVYEDMPDNSVAVCAPTRILQKEALDNTFYTVIDGVNYAARDGRLVPQK